MTRPTASAPAVSARMSRQRRRDTEPEVEIRRLLHARGLRYRVNHAVPGMPRRTMDIAFTRQRVAVFVDGCFWHSCPVHATQPQVNDNWWAAKLATNRERDAATTAHLVDLGWKVIRIWEHEDPVDAAARVMSVVSSLR